MRELIYEEGTRVRVQGVSDDCGIQSYYGVVVDTYGTIAEPVYNTTLDTLVTLDEINGSHNVTVLIKTSKLRLCA